MLIGTKIYLGKIIKTDSIICVEKKQKTKVMKYYINKFIFYLFILAFSLVAFIVLILMLEDLLKFLNEEIDAIYYDSIKQDLKCQTSFLNYFFTNSCDGIRKTKWKAFVTFNEYNGQKIVDFFGNSITSLAKLLVPLPYGLQWACPMVLISFIFLNIWIFCLYLPKRF